MSQHDWVIPSLLDLYIFDVLIPLLLCVRRFLTFIENTDLLIQSHNKYGPQEEWTDYWTIWTIRNFAMSGSEPGLLAVRHAVTDKARTAFKRLRSLTWHVEWMATHIQSWITEITDRV
jgi:hypothetical protein